jgi:hypothetical protein
VVEDPDGEHLAALFQTARYFHVLLTRSWISGWMIVDENYCGGG